MHKEFWGFSKIVSFKTNNVNAQVLGFLLNVSSSYAKIRVPDPLLVLDNLGHFRGVPFLNFF